MNQQRAKSLDSLRWSLLLFNTVLQQILYSCGPSSTWLNRASSDVYPSTVFLGLIRGAACDPFLCLQPDFSYAPADKTLKVLEGLAQCINAYSQQKDFTGIKSPSLNQVWSRQMILLWWPGDMCCCPGRRACGNITSRQVTASVYESCQP